jgi:signal transduction histidine kinase
MDDLPDVLVDKRAMKQVFFNLLRNAVQAVSPGGQIVVTAAADSSTLWVGIKDDGVGMDDQQLKQLFQPFNSTREEGTGLGLFIAYNIIREHGGIIEVTSEQHHGTEFNVLLPLVEGVDV